LKSVYTVCFHYKILPTECYEVELVDFLGMTDAITDFFESIFGGKKSKAKKAPAKYDPKDWLVTKEFIENGIKSQQNPP
jgi:hypothetical protein